MTTLPAADHISDDARTEGEVKTDLEAMVQCAKETPGGAAISALTITSGSITPTGAVHRVDTESGASTDNLDNMAVTNMPAGRIVTLKPNNVSHVVTIRDSEGGTGQFSLAYGSTFVLDDAGKSITFVLEGSTWVELSRNYQVSPSNPITTKSADYTATIADLNSILRLTTGTHSFTMPSGSTVGNGGRLRVECATGATKLTIARAGSDTFASGNSETLTSLQLYPGDRGELISDGGSPAVWRFFGKRHYDSGQVSIVASSAINFTHGLGVVPDSIGFYLHCVTISHKYAPGDEVMLPPFGYNVSGNSASTMTARVDGTTIQVSMGAVVALALLVAKGGAASALVINNADWTFIARAYVVD